MEASFKNILGDNNREKLPLEILYAFQMLFKLRYPVYNQNDLIDQLGVLIGGGHGKSGTEKFAFKLILTSFVHSDYPLITPLSSCQSIGSVLGMINLPLYFDESKGLSEVEFQERMGKLTGRQMDGHIKFPLPLN